jgi:hypothetical protein
MNVLSLMYGTYDDDIAVDWLAVLQGVNEAPIICKGMRIVICRGGRKTVNQ